ncbi:hypothetical protein VTN77DRAFT_6607 [Rasamsonia byssochlamydoides]|uniref:uncharacterized protein n=1 Tax=Rasamsonia byssochlamydoides TaxID=89139 RepID=UPI00374259D6
MVLSMLVILRDRGLPLPAGAILISPWVDLTHSFPSVAEGSSLDYIPEHGFMHRPSPAWPPPNVDDLMAIRKGGDKKTANGTDENGNTRADQNHDSETAVQGFAVREYAAGDSTAATQLVYPGLQGNLERVKTHQILANEADNLVVPMQDGTVVEIKDQIQMYAPNQLLSHPLVSPVLQPSLGGLPPLLVLAGGGELLRDEQIYLAHKAADPTGYPPNDAYLDEYDPERKILHKYEPTYVQLQVWDDLCHVAPTLSWTRPAKLMFRSIAQFGAWALARAQKDEIDIPEDDASSAHSAASNKSSATDPEHQAEPVSAPSCVGKAGDPLPPFHKHMIRQRVDRHGVTYPLDDPSTLRALKQPPAKVGAINPDIVKKWLGAKKAWDKKFAAEKLRVQRHRIRDFERGYYGFDGESPPACALASRRREKDAVPKPARKSYTMTLWSIFGSKHDKTIVKKEAKAEEIPHTSNIGVDGPAESNVVTEKTSKPRDESLSRQKSEREERGLSPQPSRDRSTSPSRSLSDGEQANDRAEEDQKEPGSAPWSTSVDDGLRREADIPAILIPGVHIDDSCQSSRTMAGLEADGVTSASGE